MGNVAADLLGRSCNFSAAELLRPDRGMRLSQRDLQRGLQAGQRGHFQGFCIERLERTEEFARKDGNQFEAGIFGVGLDLFARLSALACAFCMQGLLHGCAQFVEIPGFREKAVDCGAVYGLLQIDVGVGTGQNADCRRPGFPDVTQERNAIVARHALVADDNGDRVAFGFKDFHRSFGGIGGDDVRILSDGGFEILQRERLIIDEKNGPAAASAGVRFR